MRSRRDALDCGLPDEAGRLLTLCLCGHTYKWMSPADIRNGVAASCGRECFARYDAHGVGEVLGKQVIQRIEARDAVQRGEDYSPIMGPKRIRNMSNHSRIVRSQYRSPEGRRSPARYTANELHAFLVTDAVKGHPTDLRWAVEAYQEISRQRHQTLETATRMVHDEVHSLGKWMPV